MALVKASKKLVYGFRKQKEIKSRSTSP